MALGLSQYGSITGRRYPKHYTERINAQTPYLPQYIAAKERKELAKRDLEMRQRHFEQGQALQRDALEERKKRERQAMGLSAGKLGLNVAMNAEDTTVGDIMPKIGLGKSTGTTATESFNPSTPGVFTTGQIKQKSDSLTGGARDLFAGLQIGDIISSGLVGFGASRLIDKDASSLKKFGMGAGAGAAMNLISGLSEGNSIYDAVVGGIFGGLGGLF